jgi:hypothetical protein
MLTWIALMALLAIAAPHRAGTTPNANSSSIMDSQQESTAIDRWLTRPTRIVLTRGQRVRLDTLRAAYGAEQKAVSALAKTEGEMAVVMRMQDLDSRYQKLVRALLTSEQQVVFDENLRAGFLDLGTR